MENNDIFKGAKNGICIGDTLLIPSNISSMRIFMFHNKEKEKYEAEKEYYKNEKNAYDIEKRDCEEANKTYYEKKSKRTKNTITCAIIASVVTLISIICFFLESSYAGVVILLFAIVFWFSILFVASSNIGNLGKPPRNKPIPPKDRDCPNFYGLYIEMNSGSGPTLTAKKEEGLQFLLKIREAIADFDISKSQSVVNNFINATNTEVNYMSSSEVNAQSIGRVGDTISNSGTVNENHHNNNIDNQQRNIIEKEETYA